MADTMKEALHNLRSCTSQRKVYNTLLKILSGVATQDGLQYFKDNDGLHYILQFISKPNEKILNVSLGIMATCCSDPECCKKVISNGIVKHLVMIMRCVNQDRIHYRCFKLISILIKHPNFCSALVSNNMHELMISVLKSDASLHTQLIAIRTIRYMWSELPNNERKILSRGDLIKTLCEYLSSDNKDVQSAVLKFILCLVKYRCDIMILKQFIEKDTLQLILLKENDFPILVLQIIYYLCEIKYFHFEIVKVGALEVIFKYIREISEDSESKNEMNCDLVLRTISRLCNEPKCREKLCSIPDAFNVLLNVIEKCPNSKFKKYSVLILTTFLYNELSLRKLLKQRFIEILVGYLKMVIDTQGSSHERNSVKLETTLLSGSPSSSGRVSPLSDSGTSVGASCSPKSDCCELSPSLSLDSIYSPVYSPVMDETDEDDLEEDYEKLSIDGSSCVSDSPLLPQEEEVVKSLTEEKIFNLLRQLTFINEPIYDLCTQRTWETFLDYLVLVRRSVSQVTSLLSSVSGNKFFFSHLLNAHFALAVHKKLCRPVHTDCPHCQEMYCSGNEILSRYQTVAESSYGNQILRIELLKEGNSEAKMLLALTIPHIVRDVLQLEEYCLRYKILQFVVDSLKDDSADLLEEKVASLYSLATSIYLENPQVPCDLCKKCDVASLVKEATISFLLDDDSTVTANKHMLCEKSEFFEAMFRCGFKEAKQSTVRLSNISTDCLTALFRLLYSYCDCIVPKNVTTLLELIIQSDRFLIPTLSEKLLNITMNNRLNYKTCHLIYDWAIENGRFLPSSSEWPICHNVIKYVLVDEMTFEQRIISFKKLLGSSHRDSVLKDVMYVIETQFQCKEVKMKSHSKHYKENAAKRCKLNL